MSSSDYHSPFLSWYRAKPSRTIFIILPNSGDHHRFLFLLLLPSVRLSIFIYLNFHISTSPHIPTSCFFFPAQTHMNCEFILDIVYISMCVLPLLAFWPSFGAGTENDGGKAELQ